MRKSFRDCHGTGEVLAGWDPVEHDERALADLVPPLQRLAVPPGDGGFAGEVVEFSEGGLELVGERAQFPMPIECDLRRPAEEHTPAVELSL